MDEAGREALGRRGLTPSELHMLDAASRDARAEEGAAGVDLGSGGTVTTAETASSFKFDAFLSYAQSDAANAAAAIEDGLEKLARPWNRRRALNIYRDRSSQTATADLSGSLRRSLMQSRRLVVLASPGAAASPWVAEEVRHWRSARSSEDVLIVLVAGELHWSTTEADFDWTATTALPEAFASAFSSEPKYVDLRPLGAGRLTLHDPAFRDAVAEVSGSLTGRDKDELVGEDLRQFKKGRRIRRIGVTLLVLLTVASLVAGGVAVVQRRRAEARASQLLAERLADTTVSHAATRPLRGIAEALVSLEIRETPAGHRALVNALTTAATMPEALGSHGESVRRIEFSPDGELLLSATGQWMQLRDPNTGELVAEREVSAGDLAYRCAVAGAVFTSRGDQIVTVDHCGRVVAWGVSSADGGVVLVSAEAPSAAESLVKLIDADTGEQLGEDLRFDARITDADLSPDAQYVAVISDGNTALYEVDAFYLDRVRSRACEVLGRNAFSFEWGQLTGGRPYRRICPDAPLNSFDLD